MSGDDVPKGFVRLPLTGAIVPLKHSPGTTLTGAVAPSWRRKTSAFMGHVEKKVSNHPGPRSMPAPSPKLAYSPRPAQPPNGSSGSATPIIKRVAEPVVTYSELALSSLLKHITQLETCRPKVKPYRAPRGAVGRSVNDLLAYTGVLIAHVRSAVTLSARERSYLGLIARVIERQSSSKADELKNALAIADIASSRSAAALARPTALRMPSVPVKTLSWEILPQGKWDFGTVRAHFRTLSKRRSDLEWDLSRLRAAEALRPVECWVGQGEFDGYVVYVFRGGKRALLDHPLTGNACYILRGDWRALSRLSKYELLTEHQKRVTRIVHRGDWRRRIRGLFSAGRGKR